MGTCKFCMAKRDVRAGPADTAEIQAMRHGLAAIKQRLRGQAHRASTQGAYLLEVAAFEDWGAQMGYTVLPATEDDIEDYIAYGLGVEDYDSSTMLRT